MAVFKARARALDMLGRQQIAGIPTAISELFKNAHDAYADHVEVDFFRSARLFILRDDGLGMTYEDFVTRWLTLGTESKVGSGVGLSAPPVDQDKDQRPIMGEKGIGRLAIASIGPQVLILTRSKRNEGLGDLVAAFIHWGLFEVPGIDLDQVEIPVRTFPGGTLPSVADVLEMVNSVRDVVYKIAINIQPDTMNRIIADLDGFRLNVSLLQERYPGPTLLGDGHGTHFYIIPADESIIANLDTGGDEVSSALTKQLIGFTNTMTPEHSKPHLQTAFRDYKTDNNADDMIQELEFWTTKEFLNADHYFVGKFDEYGQFTGTISIYGEQFVEHVITWPLSQGKLTSCGSFEISVAYVQGVAGESTLPPQDYAQISSKLNKIGGLYIYKDGIRILPYGNSDADFLNIEKRRTKGAGYYFFSYRRMFGAVLIDQVQNKALTEKAGREGFRENKAYRDFKSILENFFIQVAADFFRDEASRSDRYNLRRKELQRTEVARRRHEKLASVKKREFRSQLENTIKRVQVREPELSVQDLLDTLKKHVVTDVHLGNSVYTSQDISIIERNARKSIEDIRNEYRLTKPRGIGLSGQVNRTWEVYSVEQARLEVEVFSPATRDIDKIIANVAVASNITLDMRTRLETSINLQAESSILLIRQLERKSREIAENTRLQANAVARECVLDVDKTIVEIRAKLARTDIAGLQDYEIVDLRENFISEIEKVSNSKKELLVGVTEQLLSLNWQLDDSGHFIGVNETIEALDEELLQLQERADMDVELTQLGLAIQVINHEFGASIKSVRDNLRL